MGRAAEGPLSDTQTAQACDEGPSIIHQSYALPRLIAKCSSSVVSMRQGPSSFAARVAMRPRPLGWGEILQSERGSAQEGDETEIGDIEEKDEHGSSPTTFFRRDVHGESRVQSELDRAKKAWSIRQYERE